MDDRDWQDRLREVIANEIEAATSLRDLLAEEHEALARDPEGVEHIAADKSQRLEHLEALEAQRIALLASAGYASAPEAMEACLQACDRDAVLRPAWDRLLGLVEECQRRNLRNGAIVEAARHAVGHALAILHGQEPDSGTYGASGQTGGVRLSRSLAKA